MIGETDANWRACIERTLALSPDSVTIYQMELPYNTTISGNLLKGDGELGGRLPAGRRSAAGWPRRSRRWKRAGYHVGSAYTAVKDPAKATFVYRDSLWEGADLVGLGVASFGHVNGVHLQNLDTWEQYCGGDRSGRAAARARLPAERRRAPDPRVHPAAEARRACARRISTTSTASIRCGASSRSWRRCSRRGFSPS